MSNTKNKPKRHYVRKHVPRKASDNKPADYYATEKPTPQPKVVDGKIVIPKKPEWWDFWS